MVDDESWNALARYIVAAAAAPEKPEVFYLGFMYRSRTAPLRPTPGFRPRIGCGYSEQSVSDPARAVDAALRDEHHVIRGLSDGRHGNVPLQAAPAGLGADR